MTNLHGQHEVLARQGAAQLRGRARAHDRCCDARGVPRPRQGHLHGLAVQSCRGCGHRLHHADMGLTQIRRDI